MKRIYIVSRCVKIKQTFNEFHFIGFFNGVRIKKIRVLNQQFEINEDYVLAIEDYYIEDNTLYGKCVKLKKLF